MTKKARRLPLIPGSVCKPCWELRYCPYGALVEHFPIPGGDRSDQERQAAYDAAVQEFTTGALRTVRDIHDAYQHLNYNDPDLWSVIKDFREEDISCRIYGHACPVFFLQSGGTETKEYRRTGRYIPRDVMFKVVRRDDHICQVCFTYVPDTDLEFDHIIPVARGGATTVENLRLLCQPCNSEKSDKVDDLLIER